MGQKLSCCSYYASAQQAVPNVMQLSITPGVFVSKQLDPSSSHQQPSDSSFFVTKGGLVPG